MSEEELSVEELEKKYKELLKQKCDKIQAELDKEAEELAKQKELEAKNKEREELRKEIEEEYKAKLNLTKLPGDTIAEKPAGVQMGEFESVFIEKHGLTGDSYDKIIEKLCMRGYTK